MDTMKIVLVTPYYHQPRGNSVTVERISLGLHGLGITSEILSITKNDPLPKLPAADLVHGFNASEFHYFWDSRGSSRIPYLVTLTGTDINYGLFNEKTRASIIRTLEGAKAIHVFNRAAKELLYQEVPGLKDNIHVVPQGTHVFSPIRVRVKEDPDCFIFVLPAGIRRVKNIPSAISMLAPLCEGNPKIRLWIVGPIIEDGEWDHVQKKIDENSHWIRYWGEVPHAEMGPIYQSADVVLNTSLAEGQSSAILEAMAMGIPVLVSDIAGNREIVQHGKTGFLYHGKQDFAHYVHSLIRDKGLREEMGMMGKKYVQTHHSSESEALALQNIYCQILKLL